MVPEHLGLQPPFEFWHSRVRRAGLLPGASLKDKVRTFFSNRWPVYADKCSVVVFADDDTRILVMRLSDPLATQGLNKMVDLRSSDPRDPRAVNLSEWPRAAGRHDRC